MNIKEYNDRRATNERIDARIGEVVNNTNKLLHRMCDILIATRDLREACYGEDKQDKYPPDYIGDDRSIYDEVTRILILVREDFKALTEDIKTGALL